MWTSKIMRTSTDADADIQSTSTKGGQDVDFFIFMDADKGADICFQYLRMQMLKIMQIAG